MKRFALGLAVLPFLAGVALAGQPLTNKQMDSVTAGFQIALREVTDFSFTAVSVNLPLPPGGPTGYLDVHAGFVHVVASIGGI